MYRLTSKSTVFIAFLAVSPCIAQQYAQPYYSGQQSQTWQSQSVTNHWSQQLAPPDRAHDFGTVPAFSNQEYVFEFENSLDCSIDLLNVRASCGCTKPTILTGHVEPGETAKMMAKLDTQNFRGERKATLSVVVRRNQPYNDSSEIQFQVTGTIRGDVVLNPGTVEFENILNGDSAKRVVEIKYAGNPEWRIRDITSSNPHITVEFSEKERNPQTRRVAYDLTIQLDGNQQVGPFTDQVFVTTNDVRNKHLAVNIQGNVKSTVQVAPLRLGLISKDEKIRKKMIVRGDRPFEIRSVSTGDQRIHFQPSEGSKTLHIIYYTVDTSTPGQISSNVTIQTNDPDQIETTVPFECQIVPETFVLDGNPAKEE